MIIHLFPSFSFSNDKLPKSEHVSNLMDLITPLTEMAWSFAMIALYCEFSHMMCKEFTLFSEEFHRCDWYLFPFQLQRMYLTFLLDTRQITIVRGFGNISCTRDTFKKVINCLNSEYIELEWPHSFINSYFLCLLDNKYWILLFYDASFNQCIEYLQNIYKWKFCIVFLKNSYELIF